MSLSTVVVLSSEESSTNHDKHVLTRLSRSCFHVGSQEFWGGEVRVRQVSVVG